MRLPSPLYESLPYLYLGSGLMIIAALHEYANGILMGLLLYIMGSIVWIMRSNARRHDRREQRILRSQQRRENTAGSYPYWLYEEQPFIYLALGLICATQGQNLIITLSGILLMLASLIVFKFRIQHRNTRVAHA